MIFEWWVPKLCNIVKNNETEPGTSGLERTAPTGELEFSSRSIQKNNSKLIMFFQFDLENNSSSTEGAVFSRQDVPVSAQIF